MNKVSRLARVVENHKRSTGVVISSEQAEKLISKISLDIEFGRTVIDSEFDILLSPELSRLSRTHWTPVSVAQRVCDLLDVSSGDRILDIGSGCGKFCVIGALSTQAEFVGVEQRFHLDLEARKLAESLGAKRASFTWDKMENLDWDKFNAFYLFNPFWEHYDAEIRQDDMLDLKVDTFRWYIEVVQSRLSNLPKGTRVITYHGFGGSFPSSFSQLHSEIQGSGVLELWVKRELS